MERIVDIFNKAINEVDNPLSIIGGIIIFIFLLRCWGIKKIISCSVVVGILVFLMIRIDNLVLQTLGNSEGEYFTMLVKPFFVFIIALTFLYFSFIKE